jgi:hypothetical protein
MIHIVFQKNDVDTLKSAVELDSSLQGEVVQIIDDYAVGPLADIYTEEGISARKQWWKSITDQGDYHGIVSEDSGLPIDAETVKNLDKRLQNEPDLKVWIWAAQNKHDVSGYYWLISQLKDFQGRIFILYLNNLPFINEKGNIFYPVNIFNIPPKEFLKAKKLVRVVTPSEFEVDPDEWLRLSKENRGVRILEGGKKLVQYDYDYYDGQLKKFIGPNWQSAHRIIGSFLNKSSEITGDAYLLWRLKSLLSTGELDVQGELKKMKDFEVKQKAVQPEAEVNIS